MEMYRSRTASISVPFPAVCAALPGNKKAEALIFPLFHPVIIHEKRNPVREYGFHGFPAVLRRAAGEVNIPYFIFSDSIDKSFLTTGSRWVSAAAPLPPLPPKDNCRNPIKQSFHRGSHRTGIQYIRSHVIAAVYPGKYNIRLCGRRYFIPTFTQSAGVPSTLYAFTPGTGKFSSFTCRLPRTVIQWDMALH